MCVDRDVELSYVCGCVELSCVCWQHVELSRVCLEHVELSCVCG